MFITKLNTILKYSTHDAVEAERESDLLPILAHNVIRGDRQSLLLLSDALKERDHPFADIIQRIYTDNIPNTPEDTTWKHAAKSLDQGEHAHSPWYPYHYIVTHGLVYGEPKASVSPAYLNHRNGHYWAIDFNNNTGRTGLGEISHTYLVPTTPEEVAHIANQYEKMGEYNFLNKNFADHLRRVAALRPGQIDRTPVVPPESI